MQSNKLSKREKYEVYKYMAPGFLIYCFAIVIPLLVCLYLSFTNWKGGPVIEVTGVKNYVRMWNDKNFWLSFVHNLQMIAILIFTQIGIAFLISLFFRSKLIAMKEFHRRIIFLPCVLAAIVVGMTWQLIYNIDIGIIATILKRIGHPELIISWLDDPDLVILAICITLSWQYIGQFVVIITAGMTNVDQSVLEASEIDGANSFQKTVHIIFPLIRNTISVCLIMCISGCMKIFDIIFVMTGGGPGKASMVTALYAYDNAFRIHKIGYSAANAIGMVILSTLLIAIVRLLLYGRKKNA